MNSKTWSLLRDDDPENLGGGSAEPQNTGGEVQLQEGDELNPVEVTGEEPKPAAKPAAVKPAAAPTQRTDEEMAALADRIVERRMRASQPKPKEPEMTQEQLEKLLNPVRVTREDMAELFGIEDPTTISDKRLAKLQTLLGATVKNSTSLTNVMLEQRMRNLMNEAAPMQKFYQEQAEVQQRKMFFDAHPKLEKFPKFVQFAATQVSPTKADGTEKSVAEAMTDIAAIVKDMLKETGVDIDAAELDEDGQPISQPAVANLRTGASSVPKMASLQSSGRGAAGGKPAGKSNNPDADIYS